MSFDSTFASPPPQAAPVEPMSWVDLWALAITSPTPQTYEEILENPRAQNNPMLWVGVSSALAMVFTFGIRWLFGGLTVPDNLPASMIGMDPAELNGFLATTSITGLVCMIPVAIIAAIVVFMVGVFFLHLWCKVVGGQGTFGNLLFAMAAFNVPLTAINGILSPVPYLGFLAIPLWFYTQYLTLCAVKATHRFGWGKTLIAAWVIPLILLIFLCVGVYALLMAIGMPQILEEMSRQYPR